jgi:hypothetical protein
MKEQVSVDVIERGGLHYYLKCSCCKEHNVCEDIAKDYLRLKRLDEVRKKIVYSCRKELSLNQNISTEYRDFLSNLLECLGSFDK